MNAREYFGDRFFEPPAEQEQFETFEQWAWRLVSEERRVIESLIRESVSARVEPPQPQAPPIPDGVPVNASIVEAWRTFHSAPRTRSTPAPVPRRRPRIKELRTLVADPDLRHLLP